MKRLSCLLLGILLVFSLCACQQAAPSSGEAPDQQAITEEATEYFNQMMDGDFETFFNALPQGVQDNISAETIQETWEEEVDKLGGLPKNVVMLTCDAYGVLPPIARLSPAQAMYHFLSGFTSKTPGTERGVTEPTPTFSTCFGAPFMPRRPEVYGKLLQEKIAKTGAVCWLVNTGWTGGKHGTGKRMPIRATRALLTAALDGSLAKVEFRKDPNFGFEVPVAVPGVDTTLLNPRETWADKAAYDVQAKKLVEMFSKNFEQYVAHIDDDVKAAAIG